MRIIYFLFFLPYLLVGQTPANNPEYKRLVETALEQLKNKDCKACLESYTQAFALSSHSVLSHLRAAACADHCRKAEHRDELITAAVHIDWSLCLKLIDDLDNYPELAIGDLFKNQIRTTARDYAASIGVDFVLMAELKQIYHLDQKYRIAMDSVMLKHPEGSPGFKAFIDIWMRKDSLNLARIENIIARYGFPGKSLVGEQGASTVWLVIQHAPLEKQELYFPLLTEAAEKGELKKSDWAYLLDRINMHKGIPQVYGSQVVRDPGTGGWKFHPIEDEANVNNLRAAVGLGPLENYAQQMGVEWYPPGQKK